MTKVKKKDIYLKARIISEGLNIRGSSEKYFPHLEEEPEELELPDKLDLYNPEELLDFYYKSYIQSATNAYLGLSFKLRKSGLITPVAPNEHSRLDFDIEGDEATISEGGNVLTTGKFIKKPEWMNSKLSNGMPIEFALPAASDQIINVVFTLSCMNYNTKRGCKYCNLFANPVSRKISMLPIETLEVWTKLQAEAVKIATDNGWSGNIAISGGALAPAQRGEYLGRLELVLNTLRDKVGEKVLAENLVVYNHFPPEDFSDMYKWKELSIDATSIDLEVMDPTCFAEICPGKNAYKPHEYWKKAQEYSLKVFGAPRTFGCIVLGIEPLSSFLAGSEERLSKGIIPIPLVFTPSPGSEYENRQPPSAEFIVKASEGYAESFLKHAPKFLAPVIKKAIKERKEGGISNLRKAGDNSTSLSTVFDEVKRRIQGIKIMGIGFRVMKQMFKSQQDD